MPLTPNGAADLSCSLRSAIRFAKVFERHGFHKPKDEILSAWFQRYIIDSSHSGATCVETPRERIIPSYCESARLVTDMLHDLPKPIKRVLRQLMEVAYERELHRELEKLDQRFAAWREGMINSFELNELIHKHHHGPSRELWSRYSNVHAADMVVASAVVEGLLEEGEVPAEVLVAISRQLAFYRSWQEREEPREPEA